uniref:Uncharacterized protein n=1 Tax=Solanum tuberosum TaxID=4113 RepID=M1DP68_SOLTU
MVFTDDMTYGPWVDLQSVGHLRGSGQDPFFQALSPEHGPAIRSVNGLMIHESGASFASVCAVKTRPSQRPNGGGPFLCNVTWVGKPNVGGPLKYNNVM